jgi:ADP-heptose:LPS heptosyltransferase
LVELADVAHRMLPASGLEPLRWNEAPPAVAVNLHGRGPESHRVLAAVGGSLVAYGCPVAQHEGPRWDPEEHEVRRWCRLVEEALGSSARPDDLRLERPERELGGEGTVVVHPGAAYRSRRWPPERFAEVARWATTVGYRVVVTGGAAERGLAEEVAERAGLPLASVLAGRTGLTELASLVAWSDLLVCGDTGVAHLASAFATPSVLLFGPTSPARWGPPSDGPHVVLWHGDGTGDPWADEVDPALLEIDVDEVVTAARALTSRRAGPRQRTTPTSA